MTADSRMPAIFFGHGNPMNALARNATPTAGPRWAPPSPGQGDPLRLGALVRAGDRRHGDARAAHDPRFRRLSRERCTSAVSGARRHRSSRSASAPARARVRSRSTSDWGLDHGTWSVLMPRVSRRRHAGRPAQHRRDAAGSMALRARRQLAPLRDEGVLIVGSGNIVHNLHAYAWGRHAVEPYDWALRFEAKARELLAPATIAPARRLRVAGQGCAARGADSRPLPAAALRAGAAPGGRAVTLPGGGLRRRFDLDARGAARLTGSQAETRRNRVLGSMRASRWIHWRDPRPSPRFVFRWPREADRTLDRQGAGFLGTLGCLGFFGSFFCLSRFPMA